MRASHLPFGLNSEDVMHGARRQKSQVDSGTWGGAATLDSLLAKIATASSFFRGKRRTGDGRSGSSSIGTAKRFLAVEKKKFRIKIRMEVNRGNSRVSTMSHTHNLL